MDTRSLWLCYIFQSALSRTNRIPGCLSPRASTTMAGLKRAMQSSSDDYSGRVAAFNSVIARLSRSSRKVICTGRKDD